MTHDLFAWIALACAGAAAAILVNVLTRPGPIGRAAKVWLLLGIGVLPVGAALAGNIAGYQVSKRREFCAACHEMTRYTRDAADPASTALAALHSRNAHFGEESCFTCHRDYELFGSVTTKLNGLRHLWAHYTRPPSRPIALYRPFPAANCRQCHSARLPCFPQEPAHQAVLAEIRTGEVSCASEGCHGPAHARRAAP